MTNARRHTFFGADYNISCPRQVNPKCGASSVAKAKIQADKLRGAGVVRYSLVNA